MNDKKSKEAAKLLGKKGGNATKKKHGNEYYAEIGRKGGEARGRSLRERLKQAER